MDARAIGRLDESLRVAWGGLQEDQMDVSARAPLGSSKVHVTRMGLGTVPIGGLYEPIGDEEALALVNRTWELGVRLFDTAPQYGSGLAERRLAHVLPQLPRDELIVSTKVGRLIRPTSTRGKVVTVLREAVTNRDFSRVTGAGRHVVHKLRGQSAHPQTTATAADAPAPGMAPVFDFSYDGAMRSLEESLERLKLDRVDMLLLHDPDYYFKQAMSGAYKALEKLRADGTVGAIGVGMNQSAMLTRFASEADFDCFLVAGRYTLLDQTALDDLLPVCERRGSSVIVGGVYNSGILADPRPGTHFNYEPAAQVWLDKALKIKAVCGRYDVPLKAAAVQFPLGHPAVATVLAGSRSVAEVEDNAAMLAHPIPLELWAELRAEGLIGPHVPTPGPGTLSGNPVAPTAKTAVAAT
jgi:D-threo-aldose 1-dehydrogenase